MRRKRMSGVSPTRSRIEEPLLCVMVGIAMSDSKGLNLTQMTQAWGLGMKACLISVYRVICDRRA